MSTFDTIAEEESDDEDRDPALASRQDRPPPQSSQEHNEERSHQQSTHIEAAHKELHLHELLALLSCFLFPAIGAWLLHAIRSQLSRPSEGLVSNYNLTVFMLASEIRPVSHLVKMIQARTLYLQRVVDRSSSDDDRRFDSGQISDMARRVAELEAHIANSVENSSKSARTATDIDAAKTTAQAVTETRKALQPDLDALNRAVRRYEKRTTISSLQTEARLQELESRLKDVVVLAAAAQRNADNHPKNFMLILLNWICAVVVLPSQCVWYLIQLPIRVLKRVTDSVPKLLGGRQGKNPRQMRHGNQVKAKDRLSKRGS